MRPPHPDPDQAPLTACTGRVSYDAGRSSRNCELEIPCSSDGVKGCRGAKPARDNRRSVS